MNREHTFLPRGCLQDSSNRGNQTGMKFERKLQYLRPEINVSLKLLIVGGDLLVSKSTNNIYISSP